MKKQNKKKIIITVTAVVLVVAIGLGVWFGVSRGRSEPVKVFAFNSVGMTEYWGDSQESYGPVSTDKIQTVFLSSTQTVTEMKVAQGDEVKKGDVLGVARIAGIMAAKRTSELIPLCHPLPLTKVCVDFELLPEQQAVEARCTVKTSGVTGVEMEALTGVSTALLTIYDMCKAVDKGMELSGIHLVEKTGGKSGHYIRSEGGYV